MSYDEFMMTGGGGSGGSRNVRPRKRRAKKTAARSVAKTTDTIPAFPNWFPFNEMLLDGILKLRGYGVKSRKLPWSHRGLTLLYSSGRVATTSAKAHGYDPKTSPRGVILGVGELVDVRELTDAEIRKMTGQFNNMSVRTARRLVLAADARGAWPVDGEGNPMVLPFPLGYFFRKLKRFETPVPFAWPSGAVRCTNIPVSKVAAALKAVGIREINGIRI